MKLHLCSGDVYLDGYKNIDVIGEIRGHLPDNTVKPTTLENYYVNDFDPNKGSGRVIVDDKLDITTLTAWGIFPGKSVDEVVMISSLEHFTKKQASFIVSQINRVLKKEGRFIVDVPDLSSTLSLMNGSQETDEYVMRLIYGSYRNQYNMHKWGYTFKSLRQLLNDNGDWLEIVARLEVQHDYPMIGVVAIK